ncbi:uncharacterized protein LOC116350709 [Contarinia nasturtii]|uniref:uncharacterized protein LOC116350709 n=1 Tax=Contarinia nasturtii TaxID=265458 RepID=UPI0012D41C37|nr:uncharacterized protein LOC116350709 [Contarinia nasturtii]
MRPRRKSVFIARKQIRASLRGLGMPVRDDSVDDMASNNSSNRSPSRSPAAKRSRIDASDAPSGVVPAQAQSQASESVSSTMRPNEQTKQRRRKANRTGFDRPKRRRPQQNRPTNTSTSISGQTQNSANLPDCVAFINQMQPIQMSMVNQMGGQMTRSPSPFPSTSTSNVNHVPLNAPNAIPQPSTSTAVHEEGDEVGNNGNEGDEDGNKNRCQCHAVFCLRRTANMTGTSMFTNC